jgi:hypothetical protein
VNNISDLGQIYNREDMESDNPVSVGEKMCNYLESYIETKLPLRFFTSLKLTVHLTRTYNTMNMFFSY